MLGEDGDNVADESEEGGVRSASEDDDDEVVVVGEFDRKASGVRGDVGEGVCGRYFDMDRPIVGRR
jgi:hypothetical protein